MKTFVKEFVSRDGIEKINTYADENNLEIVSVNLAIRQCNNSDDEYHYVAVFKANEGEINRYLLNVTFHAGSDDPEDTDTGLYLFETNENISKEKSVDIVTKVNAWVVNDQSKVYQKNIFYIDLEGTMVLDSSEDFDAS
jgi:hypothetical protein